MARDYDPTIGTWTTSDPIGFEGGENLYAYCGGDPVNRVDPSGLDATEDAGDWLIAHPGFSNFAVGVGDGASFGLTTLLRESDGWQPDECSGAYNAGELTGFITGAYGAPRLAGWLFSRAGGYILARLATGGWRVRALVLAGDAARPTYRLLEWRNVLRLEVHPIASRLPQAFASTHLHVLVGGEALAHTHFLLTEFAIAANAIWRGSNWWNGDD